MQSFDKSDKKAEPLFLDIETAPSLGWVWSKWETNVIDFKQDWYILSFAWKWADQKIVNVLGLDDGPNYKKDPENDEWLVWRLWNLLNEANVVIAHNGDKFDLPKINTRFLTHKLSPPMPYKTIDTLKIARSVFKFDSNKLDDLGRYLSIGRKLPHTGFHLWQGCMSGDEKSWKMMKEYNGHDVELLEKVYYIMRAWHKNHPNVNLETEGFILCPKCSSTKVQKRGFSYTLHRKKQKYQCLECRGWWEAGAVKV